MSRIKIVEHIESTPEELDSVNENNRLTLSEQLHGRKPKRSKQNRNRSDILSSEYTLRGEQY